jgi:hypothetical protein
VIAIARHQCPLSVGQESDAAGAGLGIAEIDRAGRRDCLAGDREHGDRAAAAVGDQRQLAVGTERHAGWPRSHLDGGDHRRRRCLEVDHGDLVVVGGLLWVGRVDLGRRRLQGDALVGRNGDALRHAHDRRAEVHLPEHLRRRHAEVDDHGVVGRRALDYLVGAVDVDDLVVLSRDGDLRRGRHGNRDGGGEGHNKGQAKTIAARAIYHGRFLPGPPSCCLRRRRS